MHCSLPPTTGTEVTTVPSQKHTPNPVAGSGVQKNSTDTSTHLTYDGVEEQTGCPLQPTATPAMASPWAPCMEKYR